jgi:hypothetical protein
MDGLFEVVLLTFLLGVVIGGVAASVYLVLYYRFHVKIAQDVAGEVMRENARLRVALSAGAATEESRRVQALTLAALAVPIQSPSTQLPARPKDGEDWNLPAEEDAAPVGGTRRR